MQDLGKWIKFIVINYYLVFFMPTKHQEKKSSEGRSAVFIPAGVLLGIVTFAILTFMKK